MTAPRTLLPLSRDLLNWLRTDASSWQALPLGRRLHLRWASHWNSVNLKLTLAQVADDAPTKAPVLVLGLWRSGTTVMHELLTAASGLPAPQTWQCMNACSFLMLGRPGQDTTISRPMDGLAIGPRSPQEDEFALLSMGAHSAYRAFLMPARLPELHDSLDPDHWRGDATWLPALEGFMKACLRDHPGAARRLVLKSPNHSFRALSLLDRWPDAPIVWMARDPRATLASNRKMWNQMFDAHALDGRSDSAEARAALARDLDDFLGKAFLQAARMLESLTRRCTPGQLSVVSQTALQTAPDRVMPALLEALSLGPLQAQALTRVRENTDKGRIDRYTFDVPLSAPLQEALDALEQAQRAALDSHGL